MLMERREEVHLKREEVHLKLGRLYLSVGHEKNCGECEKGKVVRLIEGKDGGHSIIIHLLNTGSIIIHFNYFILLTFFTRPHKLY